MKRERYTQGAFAALEAQASLQLARRFTRIRQTLPSVAIEHQLDLVVFSGTFEECARAIEILEAPLGRFPEDLKKQGG